MSKYLLSVANDSIALSNEDKASIINNATLAYEKFLDALRIDWRNDPNSQDTPRRVAKSYVNDLISGCYSLPPNITSFPNDGQYDGMVFSGDIEVKSICSHHNLPFFGKAYVAYIPATDGKVVGLSKLNRVVEWFSRRPQIQEHLTMQIHDYLNEVIEDNCGIAVMIKAKHMCACLRGVKHDSYMVTSKLSRAFKNSIDTRNEFYEFIK